MSNETKWTPGPWYVGESADNGIHCIDGPGSIPIEICEVWGTENDLEENFESSANAHLIAAAPELYDELCKARRTIQALIDDGYIGYVDFRSSIDTALAKARGESK